MKCYYVAYKLHDCYRIHGMQVLAKNKAEAYDKAVYEEIPKRHNMMPYSAWVVSCTYNNGNYKLFNTFEGKPY